MRLITFNEQRLGVLQDDFVIDITGAVAPDTAPEDRMIALISSWATAREQVEALVEACRQPRAVVEVSIHAPVRPRKIVAAPVNYRDHTREMLELVGEQIIERYKGFLKAPSSVIGPSEQIEIPLAGRRTDYEGELAVVIGTEARRVSREAALTHVFGYVALLDMTIRGDEDRSFRKSADTFTPLGPAIVTADEVGDPGDLRLRLWLNDELRQDATTADLVWDVPKLIECYSEVMTLSPGDLIATGTPAGVGEVVPGDAIRLWIDRVGTLEMTIAAEPKFLAAATGLERESE